MGYWRNEETVMRRMLPASLGDTTLRWFDRLPLGKINNFKKLAEQFTAHFITNSQVVNGPEVLAHMKMKQGGTLI